MSATIIDGKKIASEIKNEISEQIVKTRLRPGLAVILVGKDPASELYVSLKQKAARSVGIDVHMYRFAEDAAEQEIVEAITWLNNDDEVHAILVQLPLPKHLDANKIIQAIDPEKDVDGFHPKNIQRILESKNDITPGLSLGIIQLILASGIDLAQKQVVIVGKSPSFTGVLKHVIEAYDAKVSVIPPEENARAATQQADVLIVAAGKPGWITDKDIKEGSVIIDVGTNKTIDNATMGDVDFASCVKKSAWITPVPGGVGPMTVAMLLKNTVLLAQRRQAH